MDSLLKSLKGFICSFEINKVNLYLNLDRQYNKISKEEFVFTLSEWFKELKNNKNTELKPFKSKCTSNICCNKGCEVFVFESDVTKEYLGLKFDVFQNRVINITECSTFHYTPEYNVTKTSLNKFIVGNWVPKNTYEQYLEELFPTYDYLPTYPVIKYWIDKLKYNEVNPNFHEALKVIWGFLSDYCKYYEIVPAAEMAMSYFDKLDPKDEIKVLEWLIHYEKTYADTLGSYSFFELVDKNARDNIYTIVDEYKVDLTSIAIVKKFEAIYWNNYKKAIDTYSDYKNNQIFHEYNEQLYQGLLKRELIEQFETMPPPEIAKINKINFQNFKH